jgi:hypothetical protein
VPRDKAFKCIVNEFTKQERGMRRREMREMWRRERRVR